jgi:hypothetical protein
VGLALVLVALLVEMAALAVAALEAVVAGHLEVLVIHQALAHHKVLPVVMEAVLHTLEAAEAALVRQAHWVVVVGRVLEVMVLLIRLPVQQQGSYLAGSIT